ncbi:MAG: DUF1232 domain-containing protein [Hymenobacteraceae bacterium]|nr:DUF1232 domain-containing protein [Hymenobacteraceae bacterium]
MENQRTEGKKVAQSPFFKNIMEKAETYLKHPTKVAQLISDALKKATAKKGVGALAGEVWENLQLLSRMIKAATAGEYKGIPTSTVVGGIAVIIYFLTPIDLIPDVIPVIGLLDDASLLAWFMASIKSELDKFKEWDEARTEAAKTAPHTDTTHHADSSFGTPKYSNQSEGTVQVKTRDDV